MLGTSKDIFHAGGGAKGAEGDGHVARNIRSYTQWEGYRESRRCSRDTYPES
jgi:hypothetical protein